MRLAYDEDRVGFFTFLDSTPTRTVIVTEKRANVSRHNFHSFMLKK